MKTTVTGLLCFLWLGVASAPDVRGQDETAAKLRQAEQRIRAIYERGEFRDKWFRANWLDDSTGYVVTEMPTGSRRRIAVRYDVADGKRTELNRGEPSRRGRPENRSPDGQESSLFQSREPVRSRSGNQPAHSAHKDPAQRIDSQQPRRSGARTANGSHSCSRILPKSDGGRCWCRAILLIRK